MKIGINEFAKRHKYYSSFSHFEGTWDELIHLVNENFQFAKQGYRDGVLEVPVPPEKFRSPVTTLEEGDVVFAKFEPRQEGEEPRISTLRTLDDLQFFRNKSEAKFANIILYRKDILGNETTTDAEWEVISINASTEENEPQHFLSLMANHFGVSGGTDTNMSAEEFETKLKESYMYWKNKAFVSHVELRDGRLLDLEIWL
jgi:hypothetical protein